MHPRRSRIALTLLAAVVVALFALGAVAPSGPEFDATFGIEALRAAGWPALLAAGAVLVALFASNAVAEAVAHVVRAAGSVVPPRMRVPSFLVAVGALYFALTDTSLAGDGGGIAYLAALGVIQPSNAASSFLHVGLVELFDADPCVVLRVLSCAAGVLYAYVAVLVAREMFDDARRRVVATALLVTCGPAALFFGSLELYAPVAAGLLLYLLLGLRWLRTGRGGVAAACVLGILATLHGVVLILLPTLLFALLRAPGGRTRGRVVATAAAFLVPVALVAGALYFGAWGGSPPAGHTERFGNFLGAQGQQPLLPLVRTPLNVTHRYALLDAEHLLGVLNLIFLAAPVGLGLATLGRRRDARVAFVASAAALLVVFPLLWNVSYAHRQDWDLFSLLGVPLTLLGVVRYFDTPVSPARAVRVVALALLAFVPFVLTNAGDRLQRRRYADELAQLHGRLLDHPELAVSAKHRSAVFAAKWRMKALRRDPDRVLDRVAEAVQATRTGDHATAERVLRRVLEGEPRNAQALRGLGEVLLRERRMEEARDVLERAVSDSVEALRIRPRRLLAQIAVSEGREDDAIAQLERGLREEVGGGDAVLALRELAVIRRSRGEERLAEGLERLATRRETTGSKRAD